MKMQPLLDRQLPLLGPMGQQPILDRNHEPLQFQQINQENHSQLGIDAGADREAGFYHRTVRRSTRSIRRATTTEGYPSFKNTVPRH